MLMNYSRVLMFTLISLVFIQIQTSAQSLHRTKRKLVFPTKSRFFVRITMKEDILKDNPIFVYVLGFKTLWDLPTKVYRRPIHRRAIYEDIEHLIEQNGLNGRDCIFHYLCEASQTVFSNSNLFQKTMRIIFSIPQGEEHLYHPYNVSNYCEAVNNFCPISSTLLDTPENGQLFHED